MTLSVDQAAFLGFGFELIVYGIYVVVFMLALLFMTKRDGGHGINKFYLFFFCLLFGCGSTHVIIKLRYMDKDLIQSTLKALETGAPALRAADALVTLTDFFAQIVWIYRCWTIWHRNYWIMILPVLLSLASVSCAMSTIGLLVSTPDAAIVPPALVPLGTAAFAIPLVFNFIITGLILGRIWWQGRQRRAAIQKAGNSFVSQNHSYIYKTMVVVVESGVLYLLVQFVLVVLFALNHPAQIILADIAMQVYGLAPTSIFVRVNLRRSFNISGASDNTRVNGGTFSEPQSPRKIYNGISISQAQHVETNFSSQQQGYQEYILSNIGTPNPDSPPDTGLTYSEERKFIV